MSNEPTKETIQAWILLHRAHRQLLESVEKSLKIKALPPLDWYDVLLELYREKNAGLRQYEIGEKILLNKPNLSRLIDRLEKNQLVCRYTCAEDGRGNQIKITAKGEKQLKQVWPVYSQAIEEGLGLKLKPNELVELSRVLSKVIGQNK
jgi:DNA-binding MarR family transcriptional regulator